MSVPTQRLRWLLAGFVIACAGVFGRLVVLEIGYGDEYRAESTRPIERSRIVPATRGRILARDGTVLAADEPLIALALRYRYLEEPPDPHWLRTTARSRLTPRERRQPERLAAEEARLRGERAEMQRRLAELCGLSSEEWQARCGRIQVHVRELSERVNRPGNSRQADERGRADSAQENASPDDSWLSAAGRTLFKALFQANDEPPAAITVAEELQEHVVFEGLSLEAVAEIEGCPEAYPGVQIIRGSRRVYPGKSSAAHLLGYVRAAPNAAGRGGQAGVERQYDALLRGQDGAALDRLDHHGRLLATKIERDPVAGHDLVLTVDPALERSAEALLDAALSRRVSISDDRGQRTSGGAIVVIEVRNGAILAAASAPRFEPAVFADSDAAGIQRSLADPGHPLFDRTIQMALPPGSVFKTVSAIALLDSSAFDPNRPFVCQGYLNSPESQRCMIYRRYGIGHGPMTLVDALAQSCNVYFFHHAEQLGAGRLVDWGRRFGFGARAGIDLAGEVAGNLPAIEAAAPPSTSRPRRHEDAETLAIGQGSLTATPLQVVRMMAAIANGGQLVTPHVAERISLPVSDSGDSAGDSDLPDLGISAPQPIPGLDSRKLDIVREGLRRVVADSQGTGHATIALEGVSIAGKTGTAETGDGTADHAWFAGYAPADNPQVAFVVVLEHAGDAAASAGPVARRLVECLQTLGYFEQRSALSRL
ncbi:MAG TPA: penicillin-binding transpeptidase domain-containing protein [Pirellulales bacterium]|nr:penicillin-binding transpeptidase domain-containing protein [Pirellulales bacterium]